MHIAFLVGKFPSSTFIINQAASLIENGHEVTIFTDDKVGKGESHSESIVDKYNLLERTNEVPIPTTYSGALAFLKDALPYLAQESPVALRQALSSVSHKKEMPRKVARIYIYAKYGDEIDLCHAHFGHIGKSWSVISPQLGETPFVTTFYGFDVSKFPYIKGYDFYKGFWKYCDCAISISHHIRSQTILLGCPEKKTRKLHIGVDLSEFEFKKITYSGDEKLCILSIARLVEKKGLKYAVDAVANCVDAGLEIEYRIAGDGELHSKLQNRIEERGVSDSVTLLGWKNQTEIRQLLRNSHLLLQPSITASSGDMEGQVLVLQEAQCMGVPVIASYHDGLPEGVNEKVTGRLVPERDIQSLTDAINYFLRNPEAVGEYSNAARKYVEERFDNRKLVSDLQEVYLSLM